MCAQCSFQRLLVICLFLLGLSQCARIEKKDTFDPFDPDPTYNFGFDISDKTENVYQAHTQKMDDNVRREHLSVNGLLKETIDIKTIRRENRTYQTLLTDYSGFSIK